MGKCNVFRLEELKQNLLVIVSTRDGAKLHYKQFKLKKHLINKLGKSSNGFTKRVDTEGFQVWINSENKESALNVIAHEAAHVYQHFAENIKPVDGSAEWDSDLNEYLASIYAWVVECIFFTYKQAVGLDNIVPDFKEDEYMDLDSQMGLIK